MLKNIFLFFSLRVRMGLLRQLALLSVSSVLIGNPSGLQVIEKHAFAVYSDHVLEVTADHGAILNWDSFSIQKNETARFVLPSASSAVLNRVVGHSLSEIQGVLESNGSVALINPNGIVFSPGAKIHLANLVASAFDLSNEDFFNGKFVFRSSSGASVVNEGFVQADGYILLVGKQVENLGELKANSVFLAAGTEVVLDPRGYQRLLVSHELGMTPYESAIHLGGMVESFDEIFVDAGSGCLQVDGYIVSQGREVRLLADEIQVQPEAKITASSGEKGGTILIGGDYKGSNPSIPNAKRVWVGRGASIEASCKVNGNGGKVILWGDDACVFEGDIFAEGGPQGGDGGFIETSSSNYLDVSGFVSAIAPQGKSGTYLLDPCAVTISGGGTTAIGVCPNWTFGALAAANIQNTTLQACLNGGNSVIIDAVATGTNPSASITFLNGVTWNNASGSLTLNANPGTVTVQDSIVRSQAGAPITINATTTTIVSTGLATAQIRQDVANAITINSDLILQAGVAGGVAATAILDANTAATITINGNVTLQGGTSNANNAFAEIQSNGNVLINGDVTITGGTANGPVTGDAYAQIQTTNLASLTINGDYIANGGVALGTSVVATARALSQGANLIVNGNVTATGGTASATGARVTAGLEMAVYAPGGGDIIVNGNVVLTGGISSAASFAVANIQTESGGDIFINGDTFLQGGDAQTFDASARAVISSRTGGSTFINGNTITLLGGIGLGGSDAQIHSANGFGNININLTGPIIATGNPLAPSGSHQSYIRCLVGGNINIACSEMNFTGGLSPNAGAIVRTNQGNISIVTGDMNFIAQGSEASIDTQLLGGNIQIFADDIFLQGGNLNNGLAQIYAVNTGTVDITSRSLMMQGGLSGGVTTQSRILTDSGNITVNSASSVSINGGNHSGSEAYIDTVSAGNIRINAGFFELNGGSPMAGASAYVTTQAGDVYIHSITDAILSAFVAGSLANIETSGGTVTLIADNNISLNGFSNLETTGGSLLGIAGNDFFVDSLASVLVQTNGDLTLVCDNDFPSSPTFGSGRFTLVSGGTIENLGGGGVRIFTALPTLNSFANPAVINNFSFPLATTLTFIDVPPYEYWCVYYDPVAGAIPPFSGSAIGGLEFTVFYKVCFQNISNLIVSQEEMLFRLNYFDSYFDEYYTQFDFNYSKYLPSVFGNVLPDIQGYTFRRKLNFENVGRNPEPELLDNMPFIAQEEVFFPEQGIVPR